MTLSYFLFLCTTDFSLGEPGNPGCSPHPVGGLVLEVPVELRHPQHGLREDGGEAHGLDEGVEALQEEHEDAAEDGQAQDALHVRLEVGPLPEVAELEVLNK